MATSTNAIILETMIVRLKALTFTPTLPIAQPGITFPAIGQPKPKDYLEVVFLPNKPIPLPLGDDPEPKTGIFQVTVHWTPNVGMIKPLDAAGKVIDHFANFVLFASGIRIQARSEPWAASPMQLPDEVQIPVSIPYHAFEPET